MSFILHVAPHGLTYGYRANDNITFIQNLTTSLQFARKRHDYLYENGRRDQVSAYFAIGNFDALKELEAKLYSQSCLDLDKIREFIGTTNVTVVVVAAGRVNTITKHATSGQLVLGNGVTFTFGDVDTGSIEFANAEFTKLGYIQQLVTFVTPEPAE